MSDYLPHINVDEGVKRVANNKKLYLTLLGRFNARQMTDDLLKAINSKDSTSIIQAAHALQGAAGNLGLPALRDITSTIELEAKKGTDCDSFIDSLVVTIDGLEPAIKELIEKGN